MKAHTLETNFQMQKNLAINSELGYTRFTYFDTISLQEQEQIYRQIKYKKDASEYRTGYQNKTIRLTEYINGQSVQTIKLKL